MRNRKIVALNGLSVKHAMLTNRVDRALACLPILQQHVISKRFALENETIESYDELAAELQTSSDVIHTLELDALRRLRRGTRTGTAVERLSA